MTSTCGRSTSCSPVRPKEPAKSRPVAKGFSVKDILDLPSSKASSPSSSLLHSNSSRPDLDSDPCLPGSYHSPAVYYCSDQSPYPPRWLPPAGDLFPYSNTFCKYSTFPACSSHRRRSQHLWHKSKPDWTQLRASTRRASMPSTAATWVTSRWAASAFLRSPRRCTSHTFCPSPPPSRRQRVAISNTSRTRL